MESLYLKITLLSDVVLSASNATIGVNETLHYIPGAAILGAIASTKDSSGRPFYVNRQDGGDVLSWFHGSGLRFGCALPCTDADTAARPVPLSWHIPKGSSRWERSTATPGAAALNLATTQRAADTQYVQYRDDGFVDTHGRLISVHSRLSMKTAIEESGRARDGFLFMVESLERGQSFVARIDGESHQLDALRQGPLKQSLRIGRSRSAEYGRVEIEELSRSVRTVTLPGEDVQRLHLLLLSDCQLLDEFGQPTITPTGSHFGLPGWSLASGQTFTESRRYAPYNAARKSSDVQRHVLRMGSVITFVRDGAFDKQALEQALLKGVGLYRQEGLGQFDWLRDDWCTEHPADLSKGLVRSHAGKEISPPAPADELVNWVAKRASSAHMSQKQQSDADALYQQLSRARISASQWGQMRAIAQTFLRGGYPNQSVDAVVERQVKTGVRSLVHQWAQPLGKDKTAAQVLLDGLRRMAEKEKAGALYILAQRSYQAARRPEEA